MHVVLVMLWFCPPGQNQVLVAATRRTSPLPVVPYGRAPSGARTGLRLDAARVLAVLTGTGQGTGTDDAERPDAGDPR